MSTTIISTPAFTNNSARSSFSGPTPIAAPTIKRPIESFDALGCSVAFKISLTVTSPLNSKASFTTNTRSSRCLFMRRFASSKVEPSRTVIKRSLGVILLLTEAPRSSSKRRSRLVIIPTTCLPSRTGKPENPCSLDNAITSPTVILGGIVIGSLKTPDS